MSCLVFRSVCVVLVAVVCVSLVFRVTCVFRVSDGSVCRI